LDILIWLVENGCPANALICTAAEVNGHTNILNWARKNICPTYGS